MADKLRIGVLGLSHDHIWENLKLLNESSEGVLAAAADPHPELQEQVRSYGCQHVFADYSELLDSVPLDAVYIYADNRQGVDLALQAAARGLHIMIEKPLASRLAGGGGGGGGAAGVETGRRRSGARRGPCGGRSADGELADRLVAASSVCPAAGRRRPDRRG